MKKNGSGNKTSLIFTRETLGMTILLFCFIVTLALFSGHAIFAGFGAAICTFMYGTFGYGSFLVMAMLAYLGVYLAFEKKISVKPVPAVLTALTVYMLFMLFHAVSTRGFAVDGAYIMNCYKAAEEGFPAYTFGGVISAVLVYPVALLTTFVGAYIIFAALSVLCAVYAVRAWLKYYGKGGVARPAVRGGASDNKTLRAAHNESAATYSAPQGEVAERNMSDGGNFDAAQTEAFPGVQGQPYAPQYAGAAVQPQQNVQAAPETPRGYFTAQHVQTEHSAADDDRFSPARLGRKILFENDEFAAESYRRNGIFDENSYFNHPITNAGDYMRGFSDGKSKPASGTTYSEAYRRSVEREQSAQPTNGMVYGDAPASKLYESPEISSGITSYEAPAQPSAPSAAESGSFVAPEQPDADAPEADINGNDELWMQPEQSDDVIPSSRKIDDELFGGADNSRGDYSARDFGTQDNGAEPTFGDRMQSSDEITRRSDSTFGDRMQSSDDMTRRSDSTFGDRMQSSDDMTRRSDSAFGDRMQSSDDMTRRSESAFGDRMQSSDDMTRRSESAFGDRMQSTDDMTRRGESTFGDRMQSSDDMTRRSDSTFGDRMQSSDDLTRRSEPGFGGDRRSDGDMLRDDGSRTDDFSDFRRGEGRRTAGFSDSGSDDSARSDISSLFSASNSRLGEGRIEPDISALSRRRSNADLFDDDGPEQDDEPPVQPVEEQTMQVPSQPSVPAQSAPAPAPVAAAPVPEEKPAEAPKPHVWKKYVKPSLDLLDEYPEYNAAAAAEVEECKQAIVDTLKERKVDCEISDVTVAPALTRYDVTIFDRTSVNKALLKHKEAIAMALKRDNVSVYLNFAKGALSVEVPNVNRTTVGLKNTMLSPAYIKSKPNSLTFALGKNLDGVSICPDIRKMPHLLVAGTSGSGKSICLNSLLVSLISKYGPEELRLILVDPKQVEFVSYDKLPHLMINEIISEADKAIKALNWAIKEMERRFTLFKEMAESGARAKGGIKIATNEIDGYNAHLEEGEEKLPKLLLVLDEFGDLMLQAKKDVESRIIKLAAKGRAAGIHLILATQRPSVDCITGLIKSNLDARIGFKVGSIDDSRTIFDVGGAEKLLGKGDMYFRSKEYADGKMQRIQGCFIGPEEVQKVTDFIKANNETFFDQSVSDFINTVEAPEQTESIAEGQDSEDAKIDDAYLKALKYCVEANSASVSMIQRRFPIGYMKACKIVDWMENMNYVTKNEGSKSRKVLLSMDEFIKTYGDIDD